MQKWYITKESLSLLKLQGYTTPKIFLSIEQIIDISNENEIIEQLTIANKERILENIIEQNKIISSSQK